MNRPHSATHIPPKLYIVDQKKNFISPTCLPNIEHISETNNIIKEEAFEEEISLLQLAWNELGITPEYRAMFINNLEEANDTEKNNIFIQEKNHIKKFMDSLLALKKEIENRENNITQLKKLNFFVQNIITNGEDINSINQILQNTITLIKNLRINAVNIVKKITKVNQLTTYYSASGKFNINRLKPEYAYDTRYLFKMKEDLKFLKNSALSTFIEMNNTIIDPFLTNCAPNPNGIKSNKREIPISDDIMKLIIQSRYELWQQTVLNKIEKESNENTNMKNSDNLELNYFYKNAKNNNLLSKFEKEKFKLKFKGSFNGSNSAKQKLKFRSNFIHSTKGQNISRFLHNMKNSGKIRYDNYFYKKRNNSPLIPKKPLSSKLKKSENKNKIIIIHEEIESLKHEQFMKRLGSIQNLDNIENSKERNEENNVIVFNENIEILKNENLELKTMIKNWEMKAKTETEKRENLEIKINEINAKNKQYLNELEQISQKKKKKENELNKKIELLQKEVEILKKENSNINADDLIANIKNLEIKFLNEENARKEKETIIENLQKKLKEEKDEFNLKYNKLNQEKNIIQSNLVLSEENAKKINESKNILEEENKKIKDDIKNLEETNREKDNIIKEKEQIINEKEEEKQKILSDKKIIEEEKVNALNELELLKEENELNKAQLEKIKEENQEQKNQMEKLNEDYQKQNNELIELREKLKLLEEEKEKLNKELEEKNLIINAKPQPLLNDKIKFNSDKENVEIQNNNKVINNDTNENNKINEEPFNNNINEEISDNNFKLNPDTNNNLININYTNQKEENDKKEDILKNAKDIIKTEENIIEEEIPQKENIYQIDYYRENIFNLLTEINQTLPLEQIPDFIKRAFALDETVFSESFYFKGIFPKILVSKNINENKITGICSFHYESNENLNENLTIRIDAILVGKDYEEQIIEMINFIKNKVEYDKIMIYILYDRIGDKFITNKEMKAIIEKKLNFKWYCVVRDEKLNQRYIKYCFNKKEVIYDPNNNETTMAINALKHNKNNFLMNNVLIASINQEQNSNLMKEKFSNKLSYNKYINPNPIIFLLLNNKNINSVFNDKTKLEEMKKIMEKITKYSNIESNYGNDNIAEIKHLDEEMDNSIFKEINEFLINQNLKCVPNLLTTKVSINFETNYSTVIDKLYYNRISTDKISIFEEEKSGAKFFLIPSKDNNTLFYISEINPKLMELLIDGSKNVYEKFLEFQPSAQQQIFEFSRKSIRDVSYIPLTPRKTFKTIYIPCFSIKSHLFSYEFKDIKKEVKISEVGTNIPLKITSVDEYINVEFKPDNNIKNSFSTVEGYDLIIKDSFIMGIFDNDIINNTKLPLLQFLYITKDNFLTEDNYGL